MKQTMRTSILIAARSLVIITALVAVQPLRGKTSCQIGETKFACPKYFKLLSVNPDHSIAIFTQKKYGVGLFVASPQPGLNEDQLISDLAKTILAKLFPKEPQMTSWKAIPMSDRASKFEVGGGIAQGFNGNLSVLVKYRHLRFNGKDFFVGYASEFGRGPAARESFERGLGGDSMPGCNASVEIIHSITGEKVDDNNPCELVVTLP